MIGVVISTYQRSDGKTPFYLRRALDSVVNQTYKDYHIFLIGDNYENKDEFERIVKEYGKISAINLPFSIERDKYPMGDYCLFCSGGVTPDNCGIDLALDYGCKWVCHLDHDDWWEPDYLDLISNTFPLDPLFVCTMSTYYGVWLPQLDTTEKVYEYQPRPGGCCLSASCIKYSDTKLRVRDVFAETGEAHPADADLWDRLALETCNRNSFLIAKVTAHHDEEGYTVKNDSK